MEKDNGEMEENRVTQQLFPFEVKRGTGQMAAVWESKRFVV